MIPVQNSLPPRCDVILVLPAVLALAVTGCRKSAPEEPEEERDNSAAVEAYYAANPDFFVFASPEDIPSDLDWENGSDLSEIGSPDAVKGGTVRGGLTDFPRTFRQIGPDSNGTFRWYLTDLAMTYAHRHPNEDGYFPGLAEAWALDPKNRTVYVRLDPEARWSDGVPVTSDDALFAYYFKQTEFNQAPWYQNFFKVQYEKVTRYDERTFSITVAQKKPDFFQYVLETSPEPRHFFKGYQEDYVQYYQWRVRPTTAAYVIDEASVKKGRSLALQRVEDWWAKDRKFWRFRYNPDRIELTVVRDPDKAFEAFKKGDFDIARLNLAKYWYEKLPDDDPLVANGYIHKATFFNNVPSGGYGLWINTSKPLLDNPDIRKGIAHATDFGLVIDKFFRGDWARENSTATGYGELSHPTLQARGFDIGKAQEYFARAGFENRGPDGILVNADGQRLSFTITTGAKALTDAMTILEQQARKAGLEFKLEVLDSTAGWKKFQEKKHEIGLTGFSFSVTEIYPRYWEQWHGENAYQEDGSPKPQTNNFTLVDNPELNDLIIRYRESEHHAEKITLAHRIEEIIHDEAAYVYGFYLPAYRVGYWRWVRWPEGFNVKRSELERDFGLHWIDGAMREETLEAMKSGKTFPPVVEVYDQFKPAG